LDGATVAAWESSPAQWNGLVVVGGIAGVDAERHTADVLAVTVLEGGCPPIGVRATPNWSPRCKAQEELGVARPVLVPGPEGGGAVLRRPGGTVLYRTTRRISR
jgi:hypothetical protein